MININLNVPHCFYTQNPQIYLGGSMAKKFACREFGYDCDFMAKAKDETALMPKIKKHSIQAHNVTEMTPEMVQRVQTTIVDA